MDRLDKLLLNPAIFAMAPEIVGDWRGRDGQNKYRRYGERRLHERVVSLPLKELKTFDYEGAIEAATDLN
jgi:hypothetical protein